MTTSFPMYLRPETVNAHRSYYALIRKQLSARGIDSPNNFTEPEDLYSAWESPTLFLSQTCGMPYRNTLHGKVKLVGTPDFQLEGCQPGYYRSAMVVRREEADKPLVDFKNAVFTFNSDDSQSGYATAWQLTQKHGFWFKTRVPSGSHRESALAIAEGRADIAAIDANTWRMLNTYEPSSQQLSVIGWTDPTPALPYITAPSNDAAAMFDAISDAITELSPEHREQLNIHSLVKISADDYLAVSNPPA